MVYGFRAYLTAQPAAISNWHVFRGDEPRRVWHAVNERDAIQAGSSGRCSGNSTSQYVKTQLLRTLADALPSVPAAAWGSRENDDEYSCDAARCGAGSTFFEGLRPKDKLEMSSMR